MVWFSTVPCPMGRFLIRWFHKYEWSCARRNFSSRFFNVYIDDLSIALSNSKYGCTFGGCSVNNLPYADDMVIISPSATTLQKLLDICSVYSEKHDIVYNVKKSVCMVLISGKYKITNLHRVYLAGVLLEYVERYTYLGMIIHVRNVDYDITRQLRSIILRTNILLRTFSKCSTEVKLHLFQSCCPNLYCSHVWHIFTKTQLNKLRITYNNALRRLFNLHPRCCGSAMYAYSHMPSLDEIHRKYMYRIIPVTCYLFPGTRRVVGAPLLTSATIFFHL